MRACIAMACLVVGCSSAPAELEPASASRSAQTAAAASLVGYRHISSASRFALGSSVQYKSEFGLSKAIGSFGVFATAEKSGLVLGIPNADSPARQRPPLTALGSVHNEAVRAYFVGAGLPSSQVARVSEQPVMDGGGAEDDQPMAPSFAKLSYYFSTIFRQASEETPVVDSYAWARMNVDGDVVNESVYWPEIPAQVLADARALHLRLQDPSQKAAFMAKLPQTSDAALGRVVIRHTSGAWTGEFVAAAAYDVNVQNRVVHYNADGIAFSLPEETNEAKVSPPLRSTKQ